MVKYVFWRQYSRTQDLDPRHDGDITSCSISTCVYDTCSNSTEKHIHIERREREALKFRSNKRERDMWMPPTLRLCLRIIARTRWSSLKLPLPSTKYQITVCSAIIFASVYTVYHAYSPCIYIKLVSRVNLSYTSKAHVQIYRLLHLVPLTI